MPKDQNRLDDLWSDFRWLPQQLIDMWIMGVKAKHEQHGWRSAPGILWDKDAMVFYSEYPGTMEMLKIAVRSWRPSKRHEYHTYLVSILLGIECLGCDFAGWGTAYPEAKQNADAILSEYFIHNRTQLLNVYMPLRDQIDPVRLREGLGPSAAATAFKRPAG